MRSPFVMMALVWGGTLNCTNVDNHFENAHRNHVLSASWSEADHSIQKFADRIMTNKQWAPMWRNYGQIRSYEPGPFCMRTQKSERGKLQQFSNLWIDGAHDQVLPPRLQTSELPRKVPPPEHWIWNRENNAITLGAGFPTLVQSTLWPCACYRCIDCLSDEESLDIPCTTLPSKAIMRRVWNAVDLLSRLWKCGTSSWKTQQNNLCLRLQRRPTLCMVA